MSASYNEEPQYLIIIAWFGAKTQTMTQNLDKSIHWHYEKDDKLLLGNSTPAKLCTINRMMIDEDSETAIMLNHEGVTRLRWIPGIYSMESWKPADLACWRPFWDWFTHSTVYNWGHWLFEGMWGWGDHDRVFLQNVGLD